jgi:serine/threonine-protein kinase
METTFDGAGGPRSTTARAGQPRLPPGTTLNDRYQVDEFVGPHFYGEVYRGRDLSDGRLVTIKAISPQLLADGRVRQKLEREIQIAVQLDHKNVGVTHGLFGAMVGSDAVAYLAAEYVDGQTLREMIEKKKAAGRTFSIKGTYNVVAHLCNALIYAHGATVHGGLTPDSILVNSAGRVKVVDFGLARTLRPIDHFSAQVGAGGLAAMPPEMASSPDAADARADLYSVGVILFELLCGRPPSESFERPSQAVPGVPPAIDQVVATCLQPNPQQRYADAQTLKEALHAALAADLNGADANTARPLAGPPKASATPSRPPGAPMSDISRGSSFPPVMTPTPTPNPANRPPTPPPISSAPKPSPSTPPPGPGPGSQKGLPAVPKSFNVDAALSSTDDSTERWLIQKDKLDFGPFNMADVRSQVEGGKILGEHTIIDTETGERRKVKDHPQLREMVMQAETRMAEHHRQQMEDQEKRSHRGKITSLLAIAVLAVVGIGVGIFFYSKKATDAEANRKEKEAELLAAQVKSEQQLAQFLSGVEINMKVDPPAAKPSGSKKPRSRKGGSNNQYSDVTNLGDASDGGGDESLDQNVVQGVMKSNFKVLVGCILEERRRNPSMHNVDMDFIIKGTGNVTGVKVNGSTDSSFARCMLGKMQTVSFPKFNGAKTHASFSLSMK